MTFFHDWHGGLFRVSQMDKSRVSSKRLSNAYNEGVEAFLEFAQTNKSWNSDSDHDEDSKLQGGLTKGSKASKGKPIITYNKRGVPIGAEAKKLASFEGTIARTMVPITYASWLDVGEETKEVLWRHVSVSLTSNYLFLSLTNSS